MRDERIWGKDSAEFKPERFLDVDSDKLPDMMSVPFGFGRRRVMFKEIVVRLTHYQLQNLPWPISCPACRNANFRGYTIYV